MAPDSPSQKARVFSSFREYWRGEERGFVNITWRQGVFSGRESLRKRNGSACPEEKMNNRLIADGQSLTWHKKRRGKKMPRFYVPQPQIEKGMLRVEGDEVRHIRRVLRLKAGDEIVVFDGSAKEYEGKIVEEGPSSVVILIQNILSSKRESPLEITLAQSLLKGEKMDYLIQKATELGVKEIIPFFSSRSVPLIEKSRKLKTPSSMGKDCHRGFQTMWKGSDSKD